MCIACGQAYDTSDRRKENNTKGERHATAQFRVQVDCCWVCLRRPVCLAGNERTYFGLSQRSP
jgi:hypothetical protein